MSDSDATDRDTVVRMDGGQWYGRQELADLLDVSLRTIDRRVKRGEIDKRESPDGMIYRLVPPGDQRRDDSHSDTTEATDSDSRKRQDAPQRQVNRFLDTLDRQATQIDRLQERLETRSDRIARLEAENGKLRAGLETAADYVDDLELRLEEAWERADESEARTWQQRKRAEAAERDNERLRAELQGLRHRAEAAETERDLVEDELQQARRAKQAARQTVADVQARLRELQARRLEFHLGPFKFEWQR